MSVSENTLRPSSRDSFYPFNGHARGVGALGVNSYSQSPYTDPDLFSLDVGAKKTRFRVHRLVLSQSSELEVKPSNMLWGERASDSITLPDLDESIAHTLVHYLYSGQYQTLESFDNSSEFEGKTKTLSRYRLGTCVYCAAIRYKLPGLAELAQEKITSFADELTILELLSVARDHAFPNLPSDETWYPEYLEKAIKRAVAEEPGLFMKPEFVDQIEGDRRYRQVVMSAIVKTYASGGTGTSTPMTDTRPEEGISTSHVLPVLAENDAELPEESGAPEETDKITPNNAVAPEVAVPAVMKAETPQWDTTTVEEVTDINDLKLDEIEPSTPAPVEPEPFTDELRFSNSKTYQSFGKNDNSSDTAVLNGSREVASAHKRTDSVVQTTEARVVEIPSSVDEKAVASPEPVAAETSTPVSKKNKKKKKKVTAATSTVAEA